MSITYKPGEQVRYDGELPDGCDGNGTVTAVEVDASGDQVVTVELDCGRTQAILASELHHAEIL